MATGEGLGGGVEAVSDFGPEADVAEGLFEDLVEVFVEAVFFEGEVDVFADGEGEGVGFLEDHADAAAEGDEVEVGVEEFLVVEADAALDAATGDEVGEAVEGHEEAGFAAAGGADEGGDAAFVDVEGDVAVGDFVRVAEAEVFDLDEGDGVAAGGTVFEGEPGAAGGLGGGRRLSLGLAGVEGLGGIHRLV